MKIWKLPKTWYVSGREEHKFHIDVLLEDSDELLVVGKTNSKLVVIHSIKNYKGMGNKFTKVHIELAWEPDTKALHELPSNLPLIGDENAPKNQNKNILWRGNTR